MSIKQKTVTFFIIFICLMYTFLMAMTTPLNSDMANMVLEADDIIHGNCFLKDWYLTGITFITTDLLFFELGCLLFGVSNLSYVFAVWLMQISLIAVGMLLYSRVAIPKKNYSLGFFIAVSIFMPRFWFDVARVHSASFMWSFLAIFFADKSFSSEKKRDLIFLFISLVFASAGDILGLLAGIIPVALSSLVRSYRAYKDGQSLRRRDIAILFVAIFAFFSAVLIEKLWLIIGGADKNSYIGNRVFISINDWLTHFNLYIEGFLLLFDASLMGKQILSKESVLCGLRLLVVLLCLYASVKSFKYELENNNSTISLQLGISICVVSLAYIFTPLSINVSTTRYYCFVPIALSIMTTAFFSRRKISLLFQRIILVVSFFLIATSFYYNRITPTIIWDEQLRSRQCYDSEKVELCNFLMDNDLSYGYAEFWNASILTVYSENRIRVRQILPDGNPFYWFCKNEWYNVKPQFIIMNSLSEDSIKEKYGEGELLVINDFKILVLDNKE